MQHLIIIAWIKHTSKKQTFAEADNLCAFWKTKTFDERLHAAMEMIKIAYQIRESGFGKMEKKLFSTRSFNE